MKCKIALALIFVTVFLALLVTPVFASTQYINDVNSSPANYFGFGNGAYVGFTS